jgi:tRNA A-37 threonylcarbamoyl transferase component Bud32
MANKPSAAAARESSFRRVGKTLVASSLPAVTEEEIAALSNPSPTAWRVVKRNPLRTVYFGRMGGQDAYLKHFRDISLFRRVRSWLGQSHVRREVENARLLGARGVQTPQVLAAMCSNGMHWLATAAVSPAQRADLWHKEQLDSGQAGRGNIRQACVALAEMIARMHLAGLLQDDLHCGNILIRTDGRRPKPVLMDLHRVRKYRRLSRRRMAANLAQLYHDRQALTTRSERLRFLKHYLLASGASGILRSWQMMVENFARRHSRRQYASRDRRTLGQNRYFTRLKLAQGWRGHAVLATKNPPPFSVASGLTFSVDDWSEAFRNPAALLDGPGVIVIKDTRTSKVVRCKLSVGPHTLEVFIKRSMRKHGWKAMIDFFRPSRSIRAFRMGHALLNRRIAAALPLAALERRVGPHLAENILVTEAVEAPGMNKFLETWLSRPPRGDSPMSQHERHRLAQQVLEQLGRLVQRLHDLRFSHRDLQGNNLLIRWTPGSDPEAMLVDLDGLKMHRLLTSRRRFQGLMRLNVSLLECPAVNHAGRLRMLLGYLRRPGAGRINFKPDWRVLEDWSARKLRQQIRSRRRRQKETWRPTP